MKLHHYKILVLFSLLLSNYYLFAQCPVATGDATIACGGSATLTAPSAPNLFNWSSAPCPSLPTGGTNAFSTNCDDCVTGQIPIGFTFNYFGTNYTTAVIQSNGILGFGSFTFTGYSAFSIPASGNPNNYIAGMFADIDIRYGGTITYQTIGTAPNRQFVVSYTNVVPYNGGSAGTGTASFQIVLNENGSFNVIISQLSANWYASTSGAVATSGCENATGTVAVPVPGRNSTDWPGITPAEQDCNTFTPVVCTFLRWQEGATTISTNATQNVTPAATTTYTAYWNCGGSICTDDVVITLPAVPTTTGTTICQGTSGTITTSSCGANTIQWYTAPSGGSSIGSTSPFNPVGVAGSGLPNTNTPGTYTFYSACSNSPSCRTATSFVITAGSTAPTSISGTGTICQGQSVTLSLVGGSLAPGANWNWYTGSCGGTLVGTGTSITVTPTATTTYYVGASAGTTCPASACASGTVTLPPAGTTLANNGESATCLVNQNGYVHFYHSSGRLICSINSNGQNLGNVTATAYVFGAPVDVPACNASGYMVTAMGREWLINPQFQPASGVDVVLHFDNSEYSAQVPQANANINAWDDLASIADLKLSKYSGPLNMDNSALNNCVTSGGNGGTTLHNQAANGNTSAMLPGFSATGRFARFNISSFSEFWLHGMTGGSPLPVELSSFSASCLEAGKADIAWRTESEINCVSYLVESSRDFADWSTVGETICVGNNAIAHTYHMVDNNRQIGNTYYRLIQEDTDGNKTTYGPILLTCSSEGWSVTSHPNPADEMLSVIINTDKEQTDCVIELFDFTGKLIKFQTVSSTSYQTLVPIDVKGLSAGAYSMRVTSSDNKTETLKVIIQH